MPGKTGYVTTFCDLKKHRVFELAEGRSEAALHRALMRMKGRERVQVVCIDLSSGYRALIRKYFPNALWRFTKNNGITEGFHTKMEMIQMRAYGFRNFNNYRLRVIVLCG
jgi:transposase